MKLRLAFGVMTLLTPDLLIVDEILAVGDLAFQEKCMNHLEQLRDRGTAIVIASHDMETIVEECSSALLLSRGEALAYGDVETVVTTYREQMQSRTLEVTPEAEDGEETDLELQTNRFGSQEMTIEQVEIGSGRGRANVRSGGTLEVRVAVRAGSKSGPVAVSVAIERDADDVKCLDINTDLDDVHVEVRPGKDVTVDLQLPELELRPGRYWLDVGVFPLDWSHAYDYHFHAYPLQITGQSDDPEEPVYRPDNRRWSVGRDG